METQFSTISNPDVRHDFVMIFDVTDGNPNGDPDNGGEPRQDPIDMRGIVSPGCIKRRIRDSLALLFNESLYIASGTALDAPQLAAIADAEKANGKDKSAVAKSARQLIFERFIDVRLFGAVLTQITKIGNGGQVTGAIQIDTARSVTAIEIRRDGITRCAGATEKDGLNQNMGAQFRVPYALYTTMGTYSAALAKAQGNPISAEDLEKFWKALALHLELTPSTMRGRMILRDVLVYTHESKFGSARTQDLQAALSIKTEVESPRSIEDYKITIAETPKGVTMTRLRDVLA
ncbi:MAG: type I-C CRISPR-associated protein Cas7/Csd2 [Phormidesmis sp. CAN_BIN36]|nr:type I-C CRISPR-associated protein Cas7/Csd2 [Phormidesmis sp. CAN_BIN36]